MELVTILMVVAVSISLIIILVVAIGMRRKPTAASGLQLILAKTAKHLNGEAEPPAKLQSLVGSIPVPRSAASATDDNDEN